MMADGEQESPFEGFTTLADGEATPEPTPELDGDDDADGGTGDEDAELDNEFYDPENDIRRYYMKEFQGGWNEPKRIERNL